MADDNKDVIQIHNKLDEEEGWWNATYESTKEHICGMITGIGETIRQADERYYNEYGVHFGQDIHTMSEEDMQRVIDKSEERKQKKEDEKNEKKSQEEAKEQNQQRLNDLQNEYIVSGARITCSCCAVEGEPGDASYVVTPTSHGVYIHDLAQLNVKDCTTKNIKKFKFCTSRENPKVQEVAKMVLEDVLNERHRDFLDRILDAVTGKSDTVEVDVAVKDGLAENCAAQCIFENVGEWKDGKSDVLIDECNALLGRCTLQCKYGGIITLYSNGLENATK